MKKLITLATLTGTALWGLLAIQAPPVGATTPGSNGRIAFWADVGFGGQIYTIKPNGLGIRQLTQFNGSAQTPEWSPDGTQIAFYDGENGGVYVMNADGSNLHQVASSGGQASWTPDGGDLVYECSDCAGGDGVFLMKADGSNAPGKRLTTNPFPGEGDGNPEVSPDGQTVTFVRHKVDDELQALFAVGIDGTHERIIVPYRYEVAIKHDWAPDGKHIVIALWADFPDSHRPTVATVRPDGSDLTKLTSPPDPVATLAGSYSPNGHWIAYRREDATLGIFKLMKMRPDGTDKSVITTAPFGERGIDWGPRTS